MTRRILQLAPPLRCAVAENPGPMTLDGTRNYLLGRERTALIDPGPSDRGQEERLDLLVGEDRRVDWVLLTHSHPDHAGGAAAAARRLGARLAASEGTLRRLGTEGRALRHGADVPVDGGSIQLRALATPGHAPDHLAYLWEGEGSVFTGDVVLGSGSAMVGEPDGHMGDYLTSLERLLELRPTRLYPGHGEPIDDAGERLEQYRRHRLDREEQIREAVREGAKSVEEIRRRVYRDLPDASLEPAAEATVRAHLTHLEEQGEELPGVGGRG